MRKYLTGMAILALTASITACDRPEPADNADVAADANVMIDTNAAMANVAVDANTTDANAVDANATNNVTEQGSTDH